MKRILLTITFIIIIFLILAKAFLSLSISPHYRYELVSEKNIYSLVTIGNIEDEKLKEYYFDDTLFACAVDGNACYSNEKNFIRTLFSFDVYSKNSNLEYEIKKVQVKIDGESHNIFDFIEAYYPYSQATQVPFSQAISDPNYYVSKFFVGYLKIPCPKNSELEYIVTVEYEKENQKSERELHYYFEVDKEYELFMWSE